MRVPWVPNVRWVPPWSAERGFSCLVGSAQTKYSGAGGAEDEGDFTLRMRDLHPQPSGGPGSILPLMLCLLDCNLRGPSHSPQTQNTRFHAGPPRERWKIHRAEVPPTFHSLAPSQANLDGKNRLQALDGEKQEVVSGQVEGGTIWSEEGAKAACMFRLHIGSELLDIIAVYMIFATAIISPRLKQ